MEEGGLGSNKTFAHTPLSGSRDIAEKKNRKNVKEEEEVCKNVLN